MKISGHRLSTSTSVETAAKTSKQALFLGDPQTALIPQCHFRAGSQEGRGCPVPRGCLPVELLERALIRWPGQAAAVDDSFDKTFIRLTDLS